MVECTCLVVIYITTCVLLVDCVRPIMSTLFNYYNGAYEKHNLINVMVLVRSLKPMRGNLLNYLSIKFGFIEAI